MQISKIKYQNFGARLWLGHSEEHPPVADSTILHFTF